MLTVRVMPANETNIHSFRMSLIISVHYSNNYYLYLELFFVLIMIEISSQIIFFDLKEVTNNVKYVLDCFCLRHH